MSGTLQERLARRRGQNLEETKDTQESDDLRQRRERREQRERERREREENEKKELEETRRRNAERRSQRSQESGTSAVDLQKERRQRREKEREEQLQREREEEERKKKEQMERKRQRDEEIAKREEERKREKERMRQQKTEQNENERTMIYRHAREERERQRASRMQQNEMAEEDLKEKEEREKERQRRREERMRRLNGDTAENKDGKNEIKKDENAENKNEEKNEENEKKEEIDEEKQKQIEEEKKKDKDLENSMLTMLNESKEEHDKLERENQRLKDEKNGLDTALNNKTIEVNEQKRKIEKEINDLKNDLKYYRGYQTDKSIYKKRKDRDVEWPVEVYQPVVKEKVDAIAEYQSGKFYAHNVLYDDGNKWDLGDYQILKFKVFPSVGDLKQTIEKLNELNLKTIDEQKAMEDKHREFMKTKGDEMKELIKEYERTRDVYSCDVHKMHANYNSTYRRAFGYEYQMNVKVADALKDAQEYSTRKQRWYISTSERENILYWAPLQVHSSNQQRGQSIDYPLVQQSYKPRYFQFYISEDNDLLCKEIREFNQDDLKYGEGCIIDTFTEVFVYFNKKCDGIHRAKIMNAALAYNRFAQDGRTVNTPVVQVEAGKEPIRFTKLFPRCFEKTVLGDGVDIEKINFYSEDDRYFTYEKLVEMKQNGTIPVWVDESCLEEYMKDDEFEKGFGIKKEEYNKMKRWQKQVLRKKAGLF